MKDAFSKFAHRMSIIVGSYWVFLLALFIIIIWGITGPFFHFSDTWQLVINTSTTIITFLMVFLIQNTQNRDATVIHLKLDEIIRSIKSARNEMIDLEDCSEEEMEKFQEEFILLKNKYQKSSKKHKFKG
jgi:low affinity Fe/Cu permease